VFDRYLCLSVDVQGYGARDDVAQGEIQRVLVQLLDTAGARAGVDRHGWQRQSSGDGELALIPMDMAQRVVGEFCLELAAVLHRHNLQAGRAGRAGRLGLRLAIDEGPIQQGANGFVGRAVVGASRLVSSSVARQALAGNPDASLVVVLSVGVYRDWVGSGRGVMDRGQFRRVRIRAKEVDEDAWLWVAGARLDWAVSDAVAAGTSPATGSGPTGQERQRATADDDAARVGEQERERDAVVPTADVSPQTGDGTVRIGTSYGPAAGTMTGPVTVTYGEQMPVPPVVPGA
jgi:hypothetical protein